MTETAPIFRSVDALSGDVAKPPSAFWTALVEADSFCALEDENKSLRCRIGELEDELRDERQRSQDLWEQLVAARAQASRVHTPVEPYHGQTQGGMQ